MKEHLLHESTESPIDCSKNFAIMEDVLATWSLTEKDFR